jgi:hypothetical protein
MATEEQFINAIRELHDTNKVITFAELIAQVWGGKVVEVYIGDTYEDLKMEDSTQKSPAVVIGKVITAYAECLVMNCAYIDQQTKKLQFGNIICLNERGIRTITEVDESGILRDTFLNTRDNRIIKGLLNGQ